MLALRSRAPTFVSRSVVRRTKPPTRPQKLAASTSTRFYSSGMAQKHILVYGGAGAMGSQTVSHFKQAGYRTIAVDFMKNDNADVNIVLTGTDPQAHVQTISDHMKNSGALLDVVACTAGGWVGGNIKSDHLFDGLNKMLSANVISAVAACHVAAKFLKKGGLLVLTGSSAAFGATPGMIAYGISKAAVHQLVQSMAQDTNFTTCAVIPVTLDTPANRAAMPGADTSTWTPLDEVAKKIWEWAEGERPSSGSLIEVVTQNGKSTWAAKHTLY